MLDTVKLKLTQAEEKGVDFIEDIPPRLDPGSVAVHNFNGIPIVTGRLGNLILSMSPWQVKINGGSLCKWMLGNNYQAMERTDVQRAIERLSDILHLPIERAIVTRLDVGLSMPVDQPCRNYFNHLGLLRNAERLRQPNALYYYRHRQAECICFYDKNREQRDNREPIPAPIEI